MSLEVQNSGSHGLNLSDAVVVIQDLIDMQAVNLMERKHFCKPRSVR